MVRVCAREALCATRPQSVLDATLLDHVSITSAHAQIALLPSGHHAILWGGHQRYRATRVYTCHFYVHAHGAFLFPTHSLPFVAVTVLAPLRRAAVYVNSHQRVAPRHARCTSMRAVSCVHT